jgi:hypothetical protein
VIDLGEYILFVDNIDEIGCCDSLFGQVFCTSLMHG